jgi:uncharacterized protein YjbJ (UPF0337 family)
MGMGLFFGFTPQRLYTIPTAFLNGRVGFDRWHKPCSHRLGAARFMRAPRRNSSMNADVLKGQWKQLKGDVKMRWNKLTDDDLDVIDGALQKLEGKLQERYGWEKEQTQREIESWGRERGVWV